MLPARVHLSKKSWDRLQYLQTQTRLTPNITARIAINLALRDTRMASVNTAQPEQTHTINKDVLFGEFEHVYAAMIRQFYYEQKIDTDVQNVIRSLVDAGLHKLGHLRRFSDLKTLFL